MQAIQDSNEHLARAIKARNEVVGFPKVDEVFIESEMARTKAYQAVAYALLAVAEALKRKDE